MSSASPLEQVVLLNNDPPVSRLCFVCGLLLTDEEQRIVESETSCTQIPVANKLGDLVGNEFCIIVSKFDEICSECFHIVNQVDELEYNLTRAKNRLLTLLQIKYNLTLAESYEPKNNTPSFNILPELDEEEEVSVQIDQSDLDIVSDHQGDSFGELCNDDQTVCDNSNDVISTESSSQFNLTSNCNDVANNTSPEIKEKEMEPMKEKEGKDILCEYCCSSFYSVVELEDHAEKCHVSPDETTDISFDGDHEVFIDNTTQEDNEEKKVSNILFKCGVCDFSNEDKQVVMKHLQTIHKVVCEICGAPFEKMSALLVHYMSHGKSEGVCACKICEMPFPNKQVLARHLLVHKKNEGPITCHLCGKVCHDNLHAMYHRRNEHSIIQDLTCGLCNVPVESNVELKHHILTLHRGKKEFKCKECNKTFSRQLQYDNHRIYAHGNSLCRVCGKRIENLVKLRQHELRHARTESKKFECEVCQKVFKTPGGLKVHSVSHTGKYKLFCEFCGRGFMSNVLLEEHKGVHTKEERYVCDICGRKFVLYSTFHLHKQWHKDPYPFPCKMCSRKFRYRSERSNHVRRDHTGETPYKCEHCDAAFIKLGYLKKHLVIHTKVHPHTCHICEKGYDQKKTLARHYAKVHNDPSLLQSFPKTCQYKVALRPEEYPDSATVE